MVHIIFLGTSPGNGSRNLPQKRYTIKRMKVVVGPHCITRKLCIREHMRTRERAYQPQQVGRMSDLELGVDFDRGFSSGFSPPDIFRPFSVFGHAHKISKSITKSVSFHRRTQDKKSATKSVAKSVPLRRKIHCEIRHSHQKNPPQFHSAKTCALQHGRLILYTTSAGRCCPFAVFSASGI